MQKTEKILEIGSYELALLPEKTRVYYESLSPYSGADPAKGFFCYLLPRAEEESLSFLKKELGILPEKLFFARPLAEPDEKGEVLFLCFARLCGRLLRGGDTIPRQSEEKAGLSMIFVGEKREFQPGLPDAPGPQVELRFVISLPFDPAFFEDKS